MKNRYIKASIIIVSTFLITAIIISSNISYKQLYKDDVKYEAIRHSLSQPSEDLQVSEDKEIQYLIEDYDAYLQKRLRQARTVGAAVAIVHKGKVVFMKPYGVRSVGTSDSVDINTVFRLASVSKGFAGILAAKLHNEGILSLDTRIQEYLPMFQLKDSASTHDLTIRHTLNHTSGLVPHAYDDLIELGSPINEIYEEFNTVSIAGPPGRYYGYQNVVFSLIDTVLRAKEKKNYAQMLHDYVFEPLGMHTASASYDGFVDSKKTALPHYRYGHGHRRLAENDKYYNVAPAAGVNASIQDMTKWLIALLGYNPEVIGPCELELISNKEIRTNLGWKYLSKWYGSRKKYYGLGWRIVEYHNREVMYHGGFVDGYRAEIAFSPKDEIGIVYLENSPSEVSAEALPQFLNKFFNEMDSQDRLLALR